MAIVEPNVNQTADLFSIFQYINNVATEGLFFPIMMMVVWIIAFIGSISEGRPASRAFIFASFMSVVLGMLLALMNFFNINYVYFLILLIAFGIFWLNLSRSRNV